MAGTGGEHLDTHTMRIPGTAHDRVLKSIALYGPNASGKSNLLAAFEAMRWMVLESATSIQRGDLLQRIEPFKLDAATRTAPTTFSAMFVAEGVRYQYGFTASQALILEEYLYAYPKGRPQKWFERIYDSAIERHVYDLGDKLPGPRKIITETTRSNALFLSTGVFLNNEALNPVFDWFQATEVILDMDFFSEERTAEALLNPRHRQAITELVKAADVGIHGISISEHREDIPQRGFVSNPLERLLEQQLNSPYLIEFNHRSDHAGHGLIAFDDESAGTARFFSLAGPLYDVLRKGHILIVDELDSSFHADLVRSLVALFHDSATNPKDAQLLFTTHNASLLDQDLLRRDQFWFTEKRMDGATRLYPLTDFKPRKGTEALEKNYRNGRYGAVPFPRLKVALQKHVLTDQA